MNSLSLPLVQKPPVRSLDEARENIGRYLEEYNHDRPHRGLRDRTPREAFIELAGVLKNEALTV